MRVIGIDQGGEHIGLGVLEGEIGRKPELLLLRSVRGDSRGDAERTAELVVDALEEHLVPGTRVLLERAPDKARADVKRRGQALVGWSLGFLAGLIFGEIRRRRARSEIGVGLEAVADWRASMLLLSHQWGVGAQKPSAKGGPRPSPSREPRTVERIERGFVVRWGACGHGTPVSDLIGLRSFPHERCPKCHSIGKIEPGADERRDRWKELSCRLVRAHWPGPYEALVADARSRARTDPPDHRLAGVSDAADATWIAASAWAPDRAVKDAA